MKKISLVFGLLLMFCMSMIVPGVGQAKVTQPGWLKFIFPGKACFGAEQYTFSKGWNQFSSPYDLWQKDPKKFFVDIHGQEIPLDGKLKRWDNKDQIEIIYDAKKPSKFGNLKFGEAYWLETDRDWTVLVSGRCSNRDEKFKLELGWDTIGYPHLKNQETINALIRDKKTGEKMTMLQANDRSLISAAMFTWEAEDQSQYQTCEPDFWCEKTDLEKWQGYSFSVMRDDLELIIPAVK